MSYANYSEIGGPDGLLARRKPFKGKSMSARRDSRGTYIVRSYYTDIAWASGQHVHVSKRYWSATTSRHQNLCRDWLASESEGLIGHEAGEALRRMVYAPELAPRGAGPRHENNPTGRKASACDSAR